MPDIAEPELLDIPEPALPLDPAALLFGGALLGLLLSFELEAVESAGLLLQPSTAKDKKRPRVSATKRVRMIPSMSGWFVRKLNGAQTPLTGR
ncbi:MAG TPA: hypothetical protein VEU94_07000 [Terriglobales bacterium]|nr:hypothetical protein [Terriglobales bacterium]